MNSLGPRRPSDNIYLFGLFDYALTRDQTLRVNYNRSMSRPAISGSAATTARSAATATRRPTTTCASRKPVRWAAASSSTPARNIGWSDSSSRSVFEGQTIRVIDQFTSGGQQVRGGTRRKTPVKAVEAGRVAKLFLSKAGGITVYQFDPSERYCYYYAHLERYADGLKEGDVLQRGQVLGYRRDQRQRPERHPSPALRRLPARRPEALVGRHAARPLRYPPLGPVRRSLGGSGLVHRSLGEGSNLLAGSLRPTWRG